MKHKIICPYCGAEYSPSEIYVPKYFFKNVGTYKDSLGKIKYSEEDEFLDTKETYTCDKCNQTFKVEAEVVFSTDRYDEANFNQDDDFDKDLVKRKREQSKTSLW